MGVGEKRERVCVGGWVGGGGVGVACVRVQRAQLAACMFCLIRQHAMLAGHIHVRVPTIALDLCRVATPAGVAECQTLEVDMRRERLVVQDVVRDVWHVLAGIAFAREVEVIRRKFREASKERREGVRVPANG